MLCFGYEANLGGKIYIIRSNLFEVAIPLLMFLKIDYIIDLDNVNQLIITLDSWQMQKSYFDNENV